MLVSVVPTNVPDFSYAFAWFCVQKWCPDKRYYYCESWRTRLFIPEEEVR